MRIQRQNKKGGWDILATGAPGRISSDLGKYIYQFVDEKDDKIIIRIILDQRDLEKIKKESSS